MNIREPFGGFGYDMPSRHERDVWRFGLGIVLLVGGAGLVLLGLRFGGVI